MQNGAGGLRPLTMYHLLFIHEQECDQVHRYCGIEFVEVVFLTSSHGLHVESGVFKAMDCVGCQNANFESHLR